MLRVDQHVTCLALCVPCYDLHMMHHHVRTTQQQRGGFAGCSIVADFEAKAAVREVPLAVVPLVYVGGTI